MVKCFVCGKETNLVVDGLYQVFRIDSEELRKRVNEARRRMESIPVCIEHWF